MVKRRIPRWSSFAPMIRLRRPRLTLRSRLEALATIDDLRSFSTHRVPRSVFDFVDGAAEQEVSHTRSRETFARIEFLPRVLRDVSEVRTDSTVLGRKVAAPLILAPTGFTRLMHHAGEVAVARAAAAAGVPYVLSTMGTTSPESLSRQVPTGDNWFQLYLWQDRQASTQLLRETADAGFETLVLTVDTPVAGARLRDVRNGMTIPPSLSARSVIDMGRHPRWWWNLLTTEPLEFASLSSTGGTVADMVNRVFDPGATFADLDRIRELWQGTLVVKGVQTAEDALAVVKRGADAVLVSNHGGRQLDRSVTPVEQLPAVVAAVGGHAEVYVDGGIMRGADVVACLAMGATACVVGRAYLYGLMAGGEAGVERALSIFHSEINRTMRLLGATAVDDITREYVRLRHGG